MRFLECADGSLWPAAARHASRHAKTLRRPPPTFVLPSRLRAPRILQSQDLNFSILKAPPAARLDVAPPLQGGGRRDLLQARVPSRPDPPPAPLPCRPSSACSPTSASISRARARAPLPISCRISESLTDTVAKRGAPPKYSRKPLDSSLDFSGRAPRSVTRCAAEPLFSALRDG